MKRNFLLFLALTLLLSYTTYAAVVTGRIHDADNEVLPGTTVVIRSMPDLKNVAATFADENGEFVISDLKPSNYNILFTMMGMEDVSHNFDVKNENDTIVFEKVKLTDNSVMLSEVTVTAIRAAVVAKEDTLEFNAGSFHTTPNATVEDLLKKLPGVEVGNDGSLSSNGKSITKILVNGKEFFNDDTQAATKNLTADMVDKVQVIDKKSDLAMLTGVDDGEEETVINLTIKKDKENGLFGTLKGGYGLNLPYISGNPFDDNQRYEASLNMNYFKNGNQFSLIAGANNINDMGFGDMGRTRFRDFGGNNGIISSQRLGINFNVGKDDRLRVGGNIFYTHSRRDSRNHSETQYLFPDSTSYLSRGSKTIDNGHNIRADFRVQWNIDENNTIDFRPNFSFNSRHSLSNDSTRLRYNDAADALVNSMLNEKTNRGTSYQFNGNLIYNHKFAEKPGRSLSVQAKYSFSDTREKGTTWSEMKYYLLSDPDSLQYQWLDNHQWNNSVNGRVTWTEPLGSPAGGNFLTFAYSMNYKMNDADRYTYDLLADNHPADLPLPEFSNPPEFSHRIDSLTNSFRNAFFSQDLQIGYKKVSKKLNLEAGVVFSPSSSKSDNLSNPDRTIPTRWVWNFGPFLRFRYKYGQQSSLNINYRARTSQPSMSQLQPVPDYSDPMNIIVGNPDLKPTFTQSVNARLSDYKVAHQQSISAMLSASYALNTIVRYTTTDRSTGVRTTSYRNANGSLNLSGMFMINRPFNNRSWRVNARLMSRFSSDPGYINEDFNRSSNFILSPAAGLTFSSDIFQISLNPTYTFNMAASTLQSQSNRYVHKYGFTGDASVYLPFGLELSTDIDFAKNSGYSSGFNITQCLWNAQLSYSLLQDKSLTLSAKVYDILGQKQNISRTVSADMIVDSRYNDLTRYFMVSLAWRFTSFQKGTSSAGIVEEEMPMMPPPGEGAPMGPPPGEGRGRGMGGPPAF